MSVHYRPVLAADEPLLRRMLAFAAAWRESGEVDVEIDSEPLLSTYVEDWGRAGDDGVVAELDGVGVGAAWFRFFTHERHTYGFVDPETPELAIAIEPSARGRGIGGRLLEELGHRAHARQVRASLSVELANPALRLYERAGFVPYDVRPDAMTMRVDL